MSLERVGIYEREQEKRITYARFIAKPNRGIVAAPGHAPETTPAVRPPDRVFAKREAEIAAVDRGRPKNIPARVLLEAAAAITGVEMAALIGKRRPQEIAQPRQFAYALVRSKRPDLSLPQIGRLFKRDHTTVLYGLRRAWKMRDELPFRAWFSNSRLIRGRIEMPFANPEVAALLAALVGTK